MKLSIIMPIYNEKNTVLTILDKVNRVNLKNIEKEIIIVDDFSADGTRDILNKIKDKNIKIIYHEKNQGKGSAIRTGINHVTGNITIIQDADLEYNPEDYKRLIQPILNNETEVVYGSRLLGNVSGFNVPSHHIGNIILSFAASLLYFKNVTDMETCYKMIRTSVLKSLNLKAKRFDFEPEITAKLLKKGYTIKEIPISYKCRSFKEGKKINWRDGLKALYYLLKYRFTD